MSETMDARARAKRLYVDRYGVSPTTVIRSPGRVNLIGEHTDYSEGFVLPIAIDRAVWLALTPRPDRRVRLYADLFDEEVEFDLDALRTHTGWSAYVEGVAAMLAAGGASLRGLDGVLTSDLPAGAGLSSSAALELAAARAFSVTSGLVWDATEMALVSQRAENDWVGMNCGIMDQLVCAAGVADHAVLIDCRSLDVHSVALPAGTQIAVLDTLTRRELVDSEYNVRRDSCERAAQAFGVPTLRDLTLETLLDGRERLDDTTFRRARHVVTENQRTLDAAAALDAGRATVAGALMRASHESLRDDYEVSSPALDAMAEAANALPGCFGARMTGAGFGGSVVALVADAAAEDVIREALARYRETAGRSGAGMLVSAQAGVAVVESITTP